MDNADFSQRYAHSEADDEDEFKELPDWKVWQMQRDPAMMRRYIEYLNGKRNGERAQPQEEKEEPMLTREADDKFWSDPEEWKKAGKLVRPEGL